VLVTVRLIQPSLMCVSKPELIGEKHLSGAPLWVRLQTLSTDIRLGIKCLPETNTQA